MTLFKGVLKKWENQLEKLEEHCKPRGNKLVAATRYKVVTQVDMQNKKQHKIETSHRSMWMARRWEDITLRNAILLRLWCIKSVWKKTRICLRWNRSLWLLQTSTTVILRDHNANSQYGVNSSHSHTAKIKWSSQSARKPIDQENHVRITQWRRSKKNGLGEKVILPKAQ